jgi:hypothetical protein
MCGHKNTLVSPLRYILRTIVLGIRLSKEFFVAGAAAIKVCLEQFPAAMITRKRTRLTTVSRSRLISLTSFFSSTTISLYLKVNNGRGSGRSQRPRFLMHAICLMKQMESLIFAIQHNNLPTSLYRYIVAFVVLQLTQSEIRVCVLYRCCK